MREAGKRNEIFDELDSLMSTNERLRDYGVKLFGRLWREREPKVSIHSSSKVVYHSEVSKGIQNTEISFFDSPHWLLLKRNNLCNIMKGLAHWPCRLGYLLCMERSETMGLLKPSR